MMAGRISAVCLVWVVSMCGVKVHADTLPSLIQGSTCQLAEVGGDRESSSELSGGEAASSTFRWKGALAQSALLLGTQHALRMAQQKTRDRLGGPFWSDYLDSLEGLHGWNDGNPLVTNYGGHPLMGAITAFIQIQNDPPYRDTRTNYR